MSCERKDMELLIRSAAGELTGDEQAALDAHLADCPECRAIAEAQRAAWNALDEWTAAPISSDFDDRLYARIAAEEARPWWRRFWPHDMHRFTWKLALSMAAACAVILAVLLLRAPLTPETPTPVAAQKTVDLDQVESALDDVDMLNQIGAVAPAHAAGRSGS